MKSNRYILPRLVDVALTFHRKKRHLVRYLGQIAFARCSHGRRNLSTSQRSVATLVFLWNIVWPRPHTLLLRLECLLVAEVDRINHAYLEQMA